MTARRRDRGVTLIELLVTISIMGIAFASVFGGLGLFLRTETMQRTNASLDTDLRSYAEQLLGAPYEACAGPTTYTVIPPDGYTSTVAVKYWDGNLPAGFTPSCATDRGLQQLTIVLRAEHGVSGTLVVGKSG